MWSGYNATGVGGGWDGVGVMSMVYEGTLPGMSDMVGVLLKIKVKKNRKKPKK